MCDVDKRWDRVCIICGKEFRCINPAPYQYVVKVDGRKLFCCCYHCWLKAKQKYPKKIVRRIHK